MRTKKTDVLGKAANQTLFWVVFAIVVIGAALLLASGYMPALRVSTPPTSLPLIAASHQIPQPGFIPPSAQTKPPSDTVVEVCKKGNDGNPLYPELYDDYCLTTECG